MLRACNKVAFSFSSKGAFARKGGYFSQEEDDAIHMLDDVNCTGTEKSIMQCLHRGVQHTNCSHINAAGVTCINDMPKDMLCQCSIPNRWLHVFLVYKICLVRGYNNQVGHSINKNARISHKRIHKFHYDDFELIAKVICHTIICHY